MTAELSKIATICLASYPHAVGYVPARNCSQVPLQSALLLLLAATTQPRTVAVFDDLHVDVALVAIIDLDGPEAIVETRALDVLYMRLRSVIKYGASISN